MKQYQKILEDRIHQELKALPELQAPANLAFRVMAAIEARNTAPWYKLAWPLWPLHLRIASLVVLSLVFAGICFAGWVVPQSDLVTTEVQRAHRAFSGFQSAWNVINSLLGVLASALKQLSSGVLLGCLAALVLAYAAFVGLGTACVRLAMGRR